MGQEPWPRGPGTGGQRGAQGRPAMWTLTGIAPGSQSRPLQAPELCPPPPIPSGLKDVPY